MHKTVQKYKAVGEESRLRILRILIRAGEPLCVCEIVDVLRKPQYTISRELSILKRAGLVEERRDGKFMMYNLSQSDPVNCRIFRSLDDLPANDPLYRDDIDNLADRLALRESGKCEITHGGGRGRGRTNSCTKTDNANEQEEQSVREGRV